MKNTKRFLVLMALLAIFVAQSPLTYAVDGGPPSVPMVDFGDDVDDIPPLPALIPVDDEEPAPSTAPTSSTPAPSSTTPTPSPTHSSAPTNTHNSADLPNSGPEATYLLILLAVSISGGYLLRVSKQEN